MEEKYRKNIYCEWRFLEDYLSKIEDETVGVEELQRFMLYTYIKSLLLSPYVNLFLDVKREDFDDRLDKSKSLMREAKSNPEIKLTSFDHLIIEMNQKISEANWHLKLEGDKFIHIEELVDLDQSHLDSIYLSCTTENVCAKAMDNWGILAVSPENISELSSFVYDNGVAIRRNDFGNWRSILKSKIPVCNAMLIVDNYLLNDVEQLNENLQLILDSVLPKHLHGNIPFHLAVITALKRDKKTDLPSKDRLSKIREMVAKLRPNIEMKITILKCSSNVFHDRIILTNNLWISCGGGFDLFKRKKATKTTTVNVVCPFLTDSILWSHDGYSNLILAVKKLWGNKTPFISDSFPSFYVGDGENRLVD